MLHKVGGKMRAREKGRILVTGSIGGFVPGPYDAVYHATKAYLDSFCHALHDEWQDLPISITCLIPGPVDTKVVARADMQDAPGVEKSEKSDPAEVARAGYAAMMRGERGVVPGFQQAEPPCFPVWSRIRFSPRSIAAARSQRAETASNAGNRETSHDSPQPFFRIGSTAEILTELAAVVPCACAVLRVARYPHFRRGARPVRSGARLPIEPQPTGKQLFEGWGTEGPFRHHHWNRRRRVTFYFYQRCDGWTSTSRTARRGRNRCDRQII